MPPVPAAAAESGASRDRLMVHPTTADRVMEVLIRQQVDLHELVRVVRGDPALTVAVLRAANAVHLGQARRVGGVRRAVVLLGESFVTAAAAARVADLLFDRNPPAYVPWLWQHSLAVGCACAVLAARLGVPVDEAYTLGVVHDVGWLRASSSGPRHAPDQHARAHDGADLLERWNVPPDVVAAVRGDHLRPEEHAAPLPRLLVAAHAIADHLGLRGHHASPLSPGTALRMIGIDAPAAAILAEVERELDELVAPVGAAVGAAVVGSAR